jgi:hypothetical protein
VRISIGCAVFVTALASAARAQVPAGPPPPAGQAPGSFGYTPAYPAGYAPQYGYSGSSSKTRTSFEIGTLYGTAVLYGVGVGIWIGAEAGIDDPGLFLIAPAVLGVAAPAAVYAIDRPALRRGVPAAIAAGAVIGAGEGIGIASLQFVTARSEDAWGFRGLARATAIGATVGAAGGAALGFLQQPSPRSSLLTTSGVAWGSAIGAMFGYGTTRASIGYGEANDGAAIGGLIGYNAGLVATGALSMVHIPSYRSIAWMWAGAGIGFAASLPVFIFYAGEGGPPAKRGLVFSGTATALGLLAGGLFTSGDRESASNSGDGPPKLARVTGVGPMLAPGSIGLSVLGEL